jgi:lysophospholipase L1-like esterase
VFRFLSVLLLAAGALPAVAAEKPTLFLVGDSTVKNGTKGQQGWGDPFIKLFDADKITVENHAIGGRSSRTFQTEGRWDKILAKAKAGDFVLVQMGHNDGGALDDAARARGSIPGTGEETKEIDNPITKKKEVVHTYGWYLRKYVADAREKKMVVVLVSPVPHVPRATVKEGEVENSRYAKWCEEVATKEKVPFLHLNKLVMAKYVGLTPAEVKEKYFTTADGTHTNPAGAELNAKCVAEGLKELKDVSAKEYLLPAK